MPFDDVMKLNCFMLKKGSFISYLIVYEFVFCF